MRFFSIAVMFCALLTVKPLQAADSLSEIPNYREYSPLFSSSGQPTAGQLKTVSNAGFKRVVYLAFSDNGTAIETEDRVVKKLGMDYVHIPVDFDKPTLEDFEDFAAVMNRDKGARTLLHCQINLRASTFSFLYRVIYDGVPMAEAKTDLDAIWVPDEVWYKYIVDVLKHHGMSQNCEECDWAENEMG
ncbi:MAG: phosphatase [Xanthomonadales bacterium]|nr:phosphatase [Xanthomonadales bacterium]